MLSCKLSQYTNLFTLLNKLISGWRVQEFQVDGICWQLLFAGNCYVGCRPAGLCDNRNNILSNIYIYNEDYTGIMEKKMETPKVTSQVCYGPWATQNDGPSFSLHVVRFLAGY